jgi:hypothetical protein
MYVFNGSENLRQQTVNRLLLWLMKLGDGKLKDVFQFESLEGQLMAMDYVMVCT